MSQRSRDRLRRMRERRAHDAHSEGAMGAIKFAGFGAALLVFLAVAVGFRGEALNQALARRFETLAPLLAPGPFGVAWLEWAAFALAALLAGLALWRGLRR